MATVGELIAALQQQDPEHHVAVSARGQVEYLQTVMGLAFTTPTAQRKFPETVLLAGKRDHLDFVASYVQIPDSPAGIEDFESGEPDPSEDTQ